MRPIKSRIVSNASRKVIDEARRMNNRESSLEVKSSAVLTIRSILGSVQRPKGPGNTPGVNHTKCTIPLCIVTTLCSKL